MVLNLLLCSSLIHEDDQIERESIKAVLETLGSKVNEKLGEKYYLSYSEILHSAGSFISHMIILFVLAAMQRVARWLSG